MCKDNQLVTASGHASWQGPRVADAIRVPASFEVMRMPAIDVCHAAPFHLLSL
jgi:hypothetical protein